jgi:hypothetical protein
MGNSLGYFRSLLETNIELDGTLSFDNHVTFQVASDLSNSFRVRHDCSIEILQDGPFVELCNSIEQVDNEIECSSHSNEDSEEEDCSDDDDDVKEATKAEHDGGLARIANAVQVGKSQEVDGEFVNNPMSFNSHRSWLEVYNIAELASERQFAMHGPVNVNGDRK